MILSAVDYKFHTNEEKVSENIWKKNFRSMNLDNELEVISSFNQRLERPFRVSSTLL
jgi:hypothetical protein